MTCYVTELWLTTYDFGCYWLRDFCGFELFVLVFYGAFSLLQCCFTEPVVFELVAVVSCYFSELLLYWTVTLLSCYFTELLLYWAAKKLSGYFTKLLLDWAVTLLGCDLTELLLYWTVTLLNCSLTEMYIWSHSGSSDYMYFVAKITLVERYRKAGTLSAILCKMMCIDAAFWAHEVFSQRYVLF